MKNSHEKSLQSQTLHISVSDSGEFEDVYTTYDSNLCLDNSICYTFIVNDSYGDGLFSGGELSLMINDEVIVSDPNGGWASLSINFGRRISLR